MKKNFKKRGEGRKTGARNGADGGRKGQNEGEKQQKGGKRELHAVDQRVRYQKQGGKGGVFNRGRENIWREGGKRTDTS